MQSAIRIRAVASVALMVLSITLLHPGKASAQAPQSKFAEVNGVKLHYLIAGRATPWCCCTAMPKPATCGCR
jgi:hypothetical protein